MNWRSGFWRAWVVISTLWLLLAVAFHAPWEPAKNYWMFYSVIDSPAAAKIPETELKPWIEAALDETGVTASPDDIKRICSANGYSDQDCEALEDAHARRLLDEATRRFDEAEENLINFVMAAFLPPVGLLAFGLTVVWVLRGFRRTSA